MQEKDAVSIFLSGVYWCCVAAGGGKDWIEQSIALNKGQKWIWLVNSARQVELGQWWCVVQ